MPTEDGPLPAHRSTTAPRDRVEANRRGGRRGRGRRSLERQINGKARERQHLWAETGQLHETKRLEGELTELYADLRGERRDAYNAGLEPEGLPVFKGQPGGRDA